MIKEIQRGLKIVSVVPQREQASEYVNWKSRELQGEIENCGITVENSNRCFSKLVEVDRRSAKETDTTRTVSAT